MLGEGKRKNRSEKRQQLVTLTAPQSVTIEESLHLNEISISFLQGCVAEADVETELRSLQASAPRNQHHLNTAATEKCQEITPCVTRTQNSLLVHHVHLPCFRRVLMSDYHPMSRLSSGGGGRPPLRSLAQATGAGAEEGRSRPGLLFTGPPQDIGPGAAIRRPGSHSAAHLSASVPTRPPQGRLTRAAPLWP
ncbi:hypothetical protein SRHO_G00321570 [Serrasalmus rhombeus]